MPPTPPANRLRLSIPSTEQPSSISTDSPSLGSRHRESDVPHLRPPPLKLRKKKLVAPNHPCTTLSPVIDSEQVQSVSKENFNATLQPLPAIVVGTQLDILLVPPQISSARASSVAVPECPIVVEPEEAPEEEAPAAPVARSPLPAKRASYRTSQWLDGQGELDRKKLSVYLSGVLDPTFEVVEEPSDCTPRPFDARRNTQQHGHRQGRESWRFSGFSNAWRHSHCPDMLSKGVPRVRKDCRCPLGVVICQCYSSPEFERFRRTQSEHRPNPSVSSTTCFLQVPRARFRSALGDVQEVDTPSSPPGLMYDSEESDEFDWSLPSSPTYKQRRLHYLDTPTPAPRQTHPLPRAHVPSFSLPFSHGKQIRPRYQVDRYEAMQWGQHPSPSSTIPTLASISTVSTFTFDFGDNDDATDYDPFDDHTELTEIRTFEPVQKAKPVLVHCRGPSPQSIKYGHHLKHQMDNSGSFASSEDLAHGYATVYVR